MRASRGVSARICEGARSVAHYGLATARQRRRVDANEEVGAGINRPGRRLQVIGRRLPICVSCRGLGQDGVGRANFLGIRSRREAAAIG